MTGQPKKTDNSPHNEGASTSPAQGEFIPAPNLEPRVNQAQLARVVGTSRQAINKLVQTGKLKFRTDGTIEIKEAIQQLINNTNLSRTRIRLLREVAEESNALRAEIESLKAAIAEKDQRLELLGVDAEDTELQLEILPSLIEEAWEELSRIPSERRLSALRDLLDQALLKAADMREAGEGKAGGHVGFDLPDLDALIEGRIS